MNIVKMSNSKMIGDIEDLTLNYIYTKEPFKNNDENILKKFVQNILSKCDEELTSSKLKSIVNNSKKIYKISPGTVQINYMYRWLVENSIIERNFKFEEINRSKMVRVVSGVVVVTVLTSPFPNGQAFSCPHDCSFCPKEEASEENGWVEQPRSYLFNEPAVRRANRNKFDAAEQVWDRLSCIDLNGHKIDKVELIILGGTWSSYPEDYVTEFCRDLFYAVNTYFDDKSNLRKRLSIEDEQLINETANVKLIGITCEDRPDDYCSNSYSLIRDRKLGITRKIIGIQHTNQKILDKMNRGTTQEDAEIAITNMKNNCFKIDAHWMPDLPGSSPKIDWDMFQDIIYGNTLQVDQWKIYPCETIDHTKIKKMFEQGKYEHYSEDELINLLMNVKNIVPEWIRLNRVIRDIPTNYHIAGVEKPNLRQVIQHKMSLKGLKCKCIRCREPKNSKTIVNVNDLQIIIREYESSNGMEYFISMENSDKSIIYGFCRLRLTDYAGICRDYKKNKLGGTKIVSSKNVIAFPELLNCALIRELHVYGSMNPVYNSENKNIQHRGIGKRLLKKAEEIAIQNNFRKIAVISGVGVRNYYRKFGYNLINTFMIKELNQDISYYDMIKINIYLLKLITIILFCIIYFYIKYYY